MNTTGPFDVRVYINGTLIHTETVATLAACTGYSFAVTYTFGNLLDHVVDIRVDEPIGSGAIDEYRETNNELSRTIRHVPPPPVLPNLNVRNTDISVTPGLPPAGTNFNVDVTYRNSMSVPINPPYEVELTVIEGGIPRIENRTITSALNVGASANITLTTSLATDGDHAFRIRLDPAGLITEASEADNVAQMPLCVDFSVSAVGGAWSGGFYQGSVQPLAALIYNNGLFTATNVTVSFFVDNVRIASSTLPTVAPGLQAGSYAVSVDHLFANAGTFELKVVVDEFGTYTECREDNNAFTQTIQVRAPAPDLRIVSEYIAPSKINPDVDEPILLFISYDNLGIAASGAFKARVLVDDVPLGVDVDIPSVPPGEDGTIQLPTPYRSSLAGIRVVRARLDPDDQLNETTRTNNEASRALVVGQAPNLLFTQLLPNVICPSDGDDVVLTATVRNAGDLAADAEVHFFYITPTDTIPVDIRPISVPAKQNASVQTNWLVINKTFGLYAEIRNSSPLEFDQTDNSIRTEFCAGPYFNLLVSAVGQGIVQRTPNQNRFEGVQVVEMTAVPAAGWSFAGWQGDATGNTNPLTINLTSDQTIEALFVESVGTPSATGASRCGPGEVTLSASGAVGAQTYAWYTQPTGGVAVQEGPSAELVTEPLTSTTSFYVAIRSATLESTRSEAVATITLGECQPLIFYNAVSANEDDLNTYFRVENIDINPDTRDNRLRIFNRWGDLVFEVRNYDNLNNRFEGISRKGELLPGGIYFYKLEFTSGRASEEGYVTLKR
ncbi:MAG: gliding motility-associated C-terminal domain-containing protein [Cyclobacteriaceae bacterium]|nr:gliding motility-associated C-terminal domain-containing protein [Cyclobacteriaceae bacterium]